MDDRDIRPDELLAYLCTRWRFIAIACGTALALSLAVSFLLTPQFTATVSIAIDPPAANDPRASTVISPVYLESLRAFESYAGSDSLFAQAVEQFHLRTHGDEAVETLKRRILKVNKIKDSKILQIRVTLPDPKQAQALAQFIALETVKLTHASAQGADRELLQSAEQQLNETRNRYNDALKAYIAFSGKAPVEALQGEIESMQAVSSRTLRAAVEAEADAEEYSLREKMLSANPVAPDQLRAVHEEVAARRGRAVLLRREAQNMQASLLAKGAEFSKGIAGRDHMDKDVTLAQSAMESAATRVREIKSAAGSRGEVLNIIDPGILPQRRSSPNVFLNVVVSVSIALVTSLVYLTLAFGRRVRYGAQ
jgi:capsular polysaccharide biosynthesis protein